MRRDGPEILARWREAGEWWRNESPQEFVQYRDKKGIKREKSRPYDYPSPGETSEVRIRRLRDEKVRLATGRFVPPEYGQANAPKVGVLLHALSGFSYCRSTLHAAEIPAHAAEKGYRAALLADVFSLSGAYEFYRTCQKVGVHPLIGATIELADGGEFVLVARDATGYRSLSRLITDCHLEEPRLYPLATWERLERHAEGLLCLTGGSNGPVDRALMRRETEAAASILDRWKGLYGPENVFVQVERAALPWSLEVERRLRPLAAALGLREVAGGPCLFLRPDHLPGQDVLVCVDSLCLIEEIVGRKPRRGPGQPEVRLPPPREINAERHLRHWPDLVALYADAPELLANLDLVVERCEPHVLPGRIELPCVCPNEVGVFKELVQIGAKRRFGTLTARHRNRLKVEMNRILRLGYQRHFLMAWDMCNWAEGQGILHSGRGSVVDSVVAYCLGLTRIDALAFNLHFDRFLPDDGSKRPDIDIDFEANRREDVRQYLVRRYGSKNVATVAAFGTFGSRGIVREVGKVMGISPESISYLTKRLHGGVTPERLESALEARPELRESNIPREHYLWVFRLANLLMDLPRNARAHSSGVVVSSVPIADVVPVMESGVEGVRIMQWDKRSAKHCFDKFDVLCLRGNDVLSGTAHRIGDAVNVDQLPIHDPDVYRTMRAGHLVGVPQSASPAMRQAHMRIKTQNLMDAGIVQAGIRPGVGGAVKLNEYIARRHGKPFRLSHVDLEEILAPTLGIVVFQEQIDMLLTKFAGYSGGEAEEIRERIHKGRRHDYASTIREEVIDRIVSRGYPSLVAEDVYQLVAGFKGYGFAQGHALAFAEITVRSIYLQQRFPAPYFAALLDAQPAGYYGPATIANEARNRGVKVLPPNVNISERKFQVEDVKSDQDPQIVFPEGGIRVSLDQIAGISEALRDRVVERRPYRTFYDFVARTRPERDELELLILCGALDELHPNRRAMMWAIPAAYEYAAQVKEQEGRLPFELVTPPMPEGVEDYDAFDRAVHERRILGMDVAHHMVAFERARVLAKGGVTAAEASHHPPGQELLVVGNPIRLRFPPTQSGRRVLFFDLEDETGLLNVTCFDDTYQRYGHHVVCEPYVAVRGHTEDRDGHLSFICDRIWRYKPACYGSPHPVLPLVTADFLMT